MVVEKEFGDIAEYKGYTIRLDGKGEFYAFIKNQTGELARSETLKGLKEKLDRASKAKFGQPVLIEDHDWQGIVDSYKEGKITSEQPDGTFRIQYAGGRSWSAWSLGSLIKPTPENRAVISNILGLQKQMQDLKNLIEEEKKKLTTYTKDELEAGTKPAKSGHSHS